MNPQLEKVTLQQEQSFALKEDILPHIEIGWHWHPEYELVLLAESYGKKVVGDYVGDFQAGEVLLIAPQVPHYMRNDPAFYQGDPDKYCRAVVVHFQEDFLGPAFFGQPEMAPLRQLLQRSQRGLQIHGPTREVIASRLENMLQQQGFDRILTLLQALQIMAASNDLQPLTSLGYARPPLSRDASRIDRVFDFIFQHYTEDLSLNRVAKEAHLSPSAFCKFFKKHTGKTFSQALNEIRIGHACQLLQAPNCTVTEACYQSGYQHLSYFHRQFKAITGYAPRAYKRQFFS